MAPTGSFELNRCNNSSRSLSEIKTERKLVDDETHETGK